jgi:hypothetical protein
VIDFAPVCPTPIHSMKPAHFAVLTLLAGALAGCSSLVREPTMEVRAAINPAAPAREIKSYVISCSNQLISGWFVSDPKAVQVLGAALEKQGYDEAIDPATAGYVIQVELGFGPRVALQPVENPDSIRYANVAAMAGQGRYSQILTERNDSSGSLLVGPTGEIIPTGGWKRLMDDAERGKEDSSMESGGYDSLILRAWDRGAGEKTKVLAWEVAVRRSVDQRKPSPEHVGILIRQVAAQIEAGFSGTPVAVPSSLPAKKK